MSSYKSREEQLEEYRESGFIVGNESLPTFPDDLSGFESFNKRVFADEISFHCIRKNPYYLRLYIVDDTISAEIFRYNFQEQYFIRCSHQEDLINEIFRDEIASHVADVKQRLSYLYVGEVKIPLTTSAKFSTFAEKIKSYFRVHKVSKQESESLTNHYEERVLSNPKLRTLLPLIHTDMTSEEVSELVNVLSTTEIYHLTSYLTSKGAEYESVAALIYELGVKSSSV